MRLQQQQQFVSDLLENVPKTFRDKWIELMVRAALEEKHIDRMPDVLVSESLADQALEIARRRKEKPARTE